MWQRTDPTQFRAYNMVTFGIKIPLHYGKQRAELSQAEAELSRARNEHEAQSQQIAAELHEQYVIAQQSADVLKINRQGLVPQTRTGFQAGLAGVPEQPAGLPIPADLISRYPPSRTGKHADVAEHETAIARLEQMTGLSLAAAAKEKE